jgi:hypothetical protein
MNYYDYRATVEFSLQSLPANAVVTSAAFSYEVGAQHFAGALGGPCPLQIYYQDGVDGVATSADFGRTPSFTLATQMIDKLGVYTAGFADVSPLNNRSSLFPTGYVGFVLASLAWDTEADIYFSDVPPPHTQQLPTLTISYVVPEPGSVGVLGVGMMMLLRRRGGH